MTLASYDTSDECRNWNNDDLEHANKAVFQGTFFHSLSVIFNHFGTI